jgi:hypothetical protein
MDPVDELGTTSRFLAGNCRCQKPLAKLELAVLGKQCESVDMEVEHAELAVLGPVPMDIVYGESLSLFIWIS